MSKFSQRNYPAPRDMPTVTVPPPEPPRAVVVSPPIKAELPPRVIVHSDRLEYVAPKIELTRMYIFVDGKQGNKFEPKRAYVAHGMMVIEELGFSIPANECLVRF